MKLSWRQTLAVWWSLFWRGTLLGLLLGALCGGVLGGVLGAKGYPVEDIQRYGTLVGYLGGAVASFVSVKLAIQKHLPSLAAIAAAQSAPKGAGRIDEDQLL